MNIGAPKVKHVYNIWALILIVWAVYRWYFVFPEWVDSLILKPLVFAGPVIWYVTRIEKKTLASVGLLKQNIWRDVKIGLGIGMLFGIEGIIANSIKHGGLNFMPIVPVAGGALFFSLFLAVTDAFFEEFLARGFIFGRLMGYFNNETRAILVSALMFFMLHIPVLFARLQFTGPTLLIFIATNFIISLATSVFYAETKTLTVPTLIHAFWNMTVVLYL